MIRQWATPCQLLRTWPRSNISHKSDFRKERWLNIGNQALEAQRQTHSNAQPALKTPGNRRPWQIPSGNLRPDFKSLHTTALSSTSSPELHAASWPHESIGLGHSHQNKPLLILNRILSSALFNVFMCTSTWKHQHGPLMTWLLHVTSLHNQNMKPWHEALISEKHLMWFVKTWTQRCHGVMTRGCSHPAFISRLIPRRCVCCFGVLMMVRAHFCDIDGRVLRGMQFKVLFWVAACGAVCGAADVAGASFARLTAGARVHAVWGYGRTFVSFAAGCEAAGAVLADAV